MFLKKEKNTCLNKVLVCYLRTDVKTGFVLSFSWLTSGCLLQEPCSHILQSGSEGKTPDMRSVIWQPRPLLDVHMLRKTHNLLEYPLEILILLNKQKLYRDLHDLNARRSTFYHVASHFTRYQQEEWRLKGTRWQRHVLQRTLHFGAGSHTNISSRLQNHDKISCATILILDSICQGLSRMDCSCCFCDIHQSQASSPDC